MKLSNFVDFALTRSEMKRVTGGCYIESHTNPGTNGGGCPNLTECKAQAGALGVHYCCSSCGSASWCGC